MALSTLPRELIELIIDAIEPWPLRLPFRRAWSRVWRIMAQRQDPTPSASQFFNAAFALRSIPLLEMVSSEVIRWEHLGCRSAVIAEAVTEGRLRLLQWLRRRACELCASDHCSDEMWRLAAQHGHSSIVGWLARTQCPNRGHAALGAATSGRVRLLDWLDRTETPLHPQTSITACKHGQLEVLQWMHARSRLQSLADLPDIAAQNGHIGILRWLRVSAKVAWTRDQIEAQAVRGGHIPLLEWLYRIDAVASESPPEHLWFAAIEGGHVAMAEWLRAEWARAVRGSEPEWTDWLVQRAAQYGHVAMVQYLRRNGCAWHPHVVSNSALFGHLPMLQYAWANGAPGTEEQIRDAASGGGHRRVLEWLGGEGFQRAKRQRLGA